MKHLYRHIQMIRNNKNKDVKESPEAEQACFISSFLSWAKCTAHDHLNLDFQKKDQKMDLILLISRALQRHSK